MRTVNPSSTIIWITCLVSQLFIPIHSQPLPDLFVPESTPKFALILAPIGDTSFHTSWFQSAVETGTNRNWDVAVLYYGQSPEKFTCNECVATLKLKGAKWRLVSAFLNSTTWNEDLAHRYSLVMVADDDLTLRAGMLNRFFQLMKDYNLILAQPSICPNSYSFWAWVVKQRPNLLLRYTNFVELMAPTFITPFFDGIVRKTLGEAYTGWGLDFVWPWLLKFPRKSIAIVDGLCMEHPPPHEAQAGKERVYNAEMPRNEYEEKDYLLEKFQYNSDTLGNYGMEVWKPVEFGSLPLDAAKPRRLTPKEEMERAELLGVNIEKYNAWQDTSRAYTPYTDEINLNTVGMVVLIAAIGVAIRFGASGGGRAHRWLRRRKRDPVLVSVNNGT